MGIVAFAAGLLVGLVLALLGGGSVADGLVTGVLVGAVVAVLAWTVVALVPTSTHGPPGQH